MAFEQKEGWGALFPNDKKTADKQPDYRGEAKLNGELIEVAIWNKTTSRGGEMLSLSIKNKGAAYTPKQETKKPDPFDDDADLPF